MTTHFVDIGPARMPTYVYTLASHAAHRFRIIRCILNGLIMLESGGNPAAENLVRPDESYGLLQLNRNGGQGAGYSPRELLDPAVNLAIGCPPIAAAQKQALARKLTGLPFLEAVCASSGHNRSDGRVTADIRRFARIIYSYTFDEEDRPIRLPPPPF
jgi:hypothetical protein